MPLLLLFMLLRMEEAEDLTNIEVEDEDAVKRETEEAEEKTPRRCWKQIKELKTVAAV